MHELSICGSIAGIVKRHAGHRRVTTIHLQVGQLRQIVPDTLVYCWSLVSADTELDGSQLDVEQIRAQISCQSCQRTIEIGEFPILICTHCNGTDVKVVAGEEFLITSLDLEEV